MLIDAGVPIPNISADIIGATPDIGAYEHGYPNYWIPKRKQMKASTPIPPNKAKGVKKDADLMWLGGLNATSHRIYFGKDRNTVTARNNAPKAEQYQNIFAPGALLPETTYY